VAVSCMLLIQSQGHSLTPRPYLVDSHVPVGLFWPRNIFYLLLMPAVDMRVVITHNHGRHKQYTRSLCGTPLYRMAVNVGSCMVVYVCLLYW